MNNTEETIKELLREKKDIEWQIKESHFKGYPEVKTLNGNKYIYLRFKQYDRLSSVYAGVYSDDLYASLKEMAKTVKELNSKARLIKTKLAKLGVSCAPLDPNVLLNLDFARANLKTIIFGQAVVEGVSATFLETEEILERGSSLNVGFDDTLTILNLKNAWQYILDEDTVKRGPCFGALCNIAGFINDRQISYPDEIRTTNVYITGAKYRPPLPDRDTVRKEIDSIITDNAKDVLDRAADLVAYLCKTQIFTNGNKRTALVFANLFLICNGGGLLSISSEMDKEYKNKLVQYYDGINEDVKTFLREKCFLPMM
ncbi:MAG: Fic family protein [Bacilli bacterium]|nr:Fic family protein [Bacilli bacterium]